MKLNVTKFLILTFSGFEAKKVITVKLLKLGIADCA